MAVAVMAAGVSDIPFGTAVEVIATLAVLLKLLPFIVSTVVDVPIFTEVGETEVAVGGGFTVNWTEAVVPSG